MMQNVSSAQTTSYDNHFNMHERSDSQGRMEKREKVQSKSHRKMQENLIEAKPDHHKIGHSSPRPTIQVFCTAWIDLL